MLAALVLLAQAEKGGDPANPLANPMIPMILIIMVFFLLVVLPGQRRERKQRETLMSALKKGDEVLTSGGIIGIVHNLRPDEDEISLRVDDNCKLRVKKSSILQILKSKEAGEASA